MCLIKVHKWPRISFKPIKVYKIVKKHDNHYLAPFVECIYPSNGVIKASAKFPVIKGTWNEVITSEGVHAFINNVYKIKLKPNHEILEAEIPSFTPYWCGIDGDVAAVKIVLQYDNN